LIGYVWAFRESSKTLTSALNTLVKQSSPDAPKN